MKKAVMYGAGNIGRGFIGQLFSQSGYEVVFLDINAKVIDKLNEDRCYPVRIMKDDTYEEIIVEHVRGVNSLDAEKASLEIAEADLMATAVGVNVLPKIAAPIAAALKKRWSSGNLEPLNIIICENLLDANIYLEKLIKAELTTDESLLFDRTIGLVEASIGRMVPVMTQEMQGDNILRICVEEYGQLPVDKEAFKGEIPQINNMIPFAPFSFYIQRKLFMHNMGHAVTAYLGNLVNLKYIWEAQGSSTIKLIALRALQESAVAMSEEHNVKLYTILQHADDLIYRFGNKLLGDTIERVGKDPVRKLSDNDRLVGASKLCIKHGIQPVYVSIGIAAAFMFKPESDEAAARVQKVLEAEGIEAAIQSFCSLGPSNEISKLTTCFYNMMKAGSSLEEIILKAEKMKR